MRYTANFFIIIREQIMKMKIHIQQCKVNTRKTSINNKNIEKNELSKLDHIESHTRDNTHIRIFKEIFWLLESDTSIGSISIPLL